MRWQNQRRSSNVQDRRGRSAGGMAVGGGLGGLVIMLLVYLLGGDPGAVQQVPRQQSPPASSQGGVPPGDDSLAQFVSAVLGSTEDVWNREFQKLDQPYREPTLVLFSDQVQSACGIAGAAVGPFYCPRDAQVYIDLSFYRALKNQLGAPGDFAQAYVIAHEVGHHIQNLLGIADRVQRAQQRMSRSEANAMSVRLELQADFLAGVWAHHAEKAGLVEAGDIEEALNAASAIGDDKLQREAQGRVVPDSFTHGSSEQRVRWFRKGYETGDIKYGDTFSAERL